MSLFFEFPDHLATTPGEAWADLPRAALESLAVNGYRSGRHSAAEAGELLGHTSRRETEDLLSAHCLGTAMVAWRGGSGDGAAAAPPSPFRCRGDRRQFSGTETARN